MVKVFISHATQDNAVASRIYDYLTDAGIRCWLDNVDIKPEPDWLIQVEQAVKSSSHGLFLLSPSSVRSPSAMWEYHDLLMQAKPLYVALVDSVQSIDDLPYYLRDVAYCDLTEDFEAGMECLTRILKDGSGEWDEAQRLLEAEGRDITITLQANLRDLDTDKLVDLISRLADMGIRDIKVVNVSSSQ